MNLSDEAPQIRKWTAQNEVILGRQSYLIAWNTAQGLVASIPLVSYSKIIRKVSYVPLNIALPPAGA